MLPDWISLPEDHMVATIGNDHFSMTQSTVDEDPDTVFNEYKNNIYRQTSENLCEWAEIFNEGSSDIGALVLQSIRTIKALLSMVNSSDGPSYDHVFRKGTHILRILQILQANPVTRSRIIQRHSRTEYQSKNNALRDTLQVFHGGITHAIGAADDAKQRLEVLLQRTSLEKLDQELDAIAPCLEWALNFLNWRSAKGKIKSNPTHPLSIIRRHLDQFKRRGSLENMLWCLHVRERSRPKTGAGSPGNAGPSLAHAAGGGEGQEGVDGIDSNDSDGRKIVVRRQISELLKQNIHSRNTQGQTPLHLAVTVGDEEAVNLLLPGSRLDVQDHDGRTALHTAVMNGNERIARLLLSNGAKIGTVAKNKMSPLAESVSMNHRAMTNLLITKLCAKSDLYNSC
jgi:hypothetical protein